MTLAIVGIGEDGWAGLSAAARGAIETADVVVGAARHLAFVPAVKAERIAWPSPLLPFVDEVVTAQRERAVTVLASGDPMLYGIGAIFAQRVPLEQVRIIPSVSAFALACARLGWPSAHVDLVSAVARPLAALSARMQTGRRLIVYSEDGTTPAAIAALLTARGYGASALSVIEHAGGPLERRRDGIAATWIPERCADLNVVAVTCIADAGTRALSTVPGLPDDAFETDGQLTKRDVRAATLARLVPLPGQLLWDIGAGTGSIGIEWMRTDPSCRAIAFERDPDRVVRIANNAERLGVPGLRIVTGIAPQSLAGNERPDAVFIGGGVGTPELVDTAWAALAPGGRLVANAVTIPGEADLVRWHATFGGELVRIAISRAEPIGSMLAWRPMLPITQWAITKS